VRMIVPPLSRRKPIDRNLVGFFRTHRPSAFRRAIADLCAYYHVKCPRIEWFEYLDWGKTAGKTYEDGRIHLVHPENWKRGRIYKSERKWVNMIYHEMAHYLFWTDAERKADAFSRRMVLGLRDSPTRPVAKPRASARRRAPSSARGTTARARRRRVAAIRGRRRRRRAA